MFVAGARPNFMKIGPLMWQARRMPHMDTTLVHTGQHYDQRMSGLFFEELGIPEPDVNLDVRSGSHAVQTAEVMRRFEPVLLEYRPDILVVVGDVNSTLACSLVSVKVGIPVAHVEAGLRSFDRSMPEEINRILTDAMSDWLFVSEPSGVVNLRREGVPEEKIHNVGNVMIDTLFACRGRAARSSILEQVELRKGEYVVVTLHRPANVDDPRIFGHLMDVFDRISQKIPIVFPVHPRTRAALLAGGILATDTFKLIDPLGYLDFIHLVANARFVLTDSGGIQEEATVLGIPCLTLRENTERPVTVECGTNQLVGMNPERILAAARRVLAGECFGGRIPELWDGRAAVRIMSVLSGGCRPQLNPTEPEAGVVAHV